MYGIKKCPFTHKKAFWDFIRNGFGPGRCKGWCGMAHPRLCRQSLHTGICDTMGTNQKCANGYHRINTTVPVQGVNDQNSRKNQMRNLDQNSGKIREEILTKIVENVI